MKLTAESCHPSVIFLPTIYWDYYAHSVGIAFLYWQVALTWGEEEAPF